MSSSQINEIKAKIAAEESILANLKRARDSFLENIGYQMARFEQEIYELSVSLQLAEADKTFYTAAQAAAEDEQVNRFFAAEENQEDPCYHCGREYHSCLCAEAPDHADAQVNEATHDVWGGEERELSATAPPFYPPNGVRPEGTKLKWVSSSNPETYRVAIVKKHGVIEVKSVTDGRGYCHNSATCQCKPCSEINLSARLGVARPPWLNGPPLIKTFFETEAAWCLSLPVGGVLTITEPQLSDLALKKLCMKPLTSVTDALKLKELEERFPGATMVLSTKDRQYEIAYKQDPFYGEIHCEKERICAQFFAGFGAHGKPNLMAEWKGLYIDLSHLF
jgi:hypothetical protein